MISSYTFNASLLNYILNAYSLKNADKNEKS